MVGEGTILRRITQARRSLQNIMSQDPTKIKDDDEFEFQVYKSDWRISWEKGNRALELAQQVKEEGYYTISIELCFYCIERGFETWIMKKKKGKGFRAKHGDDPSQAISYWIKCAGREPL